jgi:hypothetical protein
MAHDNGAAVSRSEAPMAASTPQALSQHLDLFYNSCFPFPRIENVLAPNFLAQLNSFVSCIDPNNIDAPSLYHLKTKMSQSTTTANDCKSPNFLSSDTPIERYIVQLAQANSAADLKLIESGTWAEVRASTIKYSAKAPSMKTPVDLQHARKTTSSRSGFTAEAFPAQVLW